MRRSMAPSHGERNRSVIGPRRRQGPGRNVRSCSFVTGAVGVPAARIGAGHGADFALPLAFAPALAPGGVLDAAASACR